MAESFIIHNNLINVVNLLTNEEAGELFKMILSFGNGIEENTDNLIVDLAFLPIKQQITRDRELYQKKLINKIKPKSKYGKKLLDPRWQKKRLEVMQRDNFTCTICGDKENTLNVHHNEYKGNPWDIENEKLATLCGSCHTNIENSKNNS